MPLILTDLTGKKNDWRLVFLDELAKSCCVAAACKRARVSRVRAYDHRNRFPRFRERWEEALTVAVEALEYEVRRRAFDATDPASHVLAIFLLKAHKPAVYRDNAYLIPPPVPEAEAEPDMLSEEALARLSYDEIVTLESLVKKLSGEPEPDQPKASS